MARSLGFKAKCCLGPAAPEAAKFWAPQRPTESQYGEGPPHLYLHKPSDDSKAHPFENHWLRETRPRTEKQGRCPLRNTGVPVVAQQLTNLTSIQEVTGLIPSLAP